MRELRSMDLCVDLSGWPRRSGEASPLADHYKLQDRNLETTRAGGDDSLPLPPLSPPLGIDREETSSQEHRCAKVVDRCIRRAPIGSSYAIAFQARLAFVWVATKKSPFLLTHGRPTINMIVGRHRSYSPSLPKRWKGVMTLTRAPPQKMNKGSSARYTFCIF